MKLEAKHNPNSIKKHWDLMLLLVPGLVLLGVFNYGPMIGTVLAFKDFHVDLGIMKSPWVGLDNFYQLFSSMDFLNAIRNTLLISVIHMFFEFTMPILLALLLNEIRLHWFKRIIQTVTYLPYFFSWVILGGIFLLVLSRQGPLNSFLIYFGFEPIQFFTNDVWFIITLVVTKIWKGIGYGAVIYLAALSGINPTLYEAASIDGANRFQQIRNITLPSLVPTIVILFILSLGDILNAGFDQVYNMYNPLVYDVSDIIDTYVLRHMEQMDYSIATAAGLFKSIVGLVLIVGVNKITNKMTNNEQGVW